MTLSDSAGSTEIRWFLAAGREEDEETVCPDPHDEIVILSVRLEYGVPCITYARAGNDDLLGWELTEIAAHALYFKVESHGDRVDIPWTKLSDSSKRVYIGYAQTMLAEVTEYMKEKREAREGS